MPVSIDDGRGAAVTLRMVYEQPGVSLAVAGGGSVSITPIKPLPVDPIYRIAFTPSAALTAIGAATQTRAFAIGAAAATQFMAAVVQARSSQMQAAAELQPVGGKTDSRLIQFTPSARLDPFIEGAQIEARDIRLTPSAALSPVGAQIEARAVQTSSTAELQPVGGRIVLRSAAIAASVTTSFVGEAVSVASFLLDTYPGAEGAWSLRKLSSSTTNVIRARRSSDNAEADFTADDVADGTLESWVGAGGNGYVVTLYEQSGSGQNVSRSTASQQPTIVSGGAIVARNGKPAIDFSGRGPLSTGANSTMDFSGNHLNYFSVCETNEVTNGRLFSQFSLVNLRQSHPVVVIKDTSDEFNLSQSSFTTNFSAQSLVSFFLDGAAGGGPFYINGALEEDVSLSPTSGNDPWNGTIKTSSPNEFFIGGATASDNIWPGTQQELIIYATDQSANRDAIEQDIADYYGITIS